MLRLGKMRHALIGLFERMPWLGWGCWVIFCVIALARTTPRRFGSTFEVYLDYAHRFFTQQQLYDPSTLGAFLYWPISLVILRPFLSIALIPAAMVALFLSALLMSYAAIKLVQALLPLETRRAVMLAGVLLLINIPACWFNFKYIQAQIGMTAGMMLAAAAMMRARFPWHRFGFSSAR